ncbi:hypothetical protein AVEN_98711-1 [Araneus ventricosus]|uniref:Uncharacterized protein n=1 Tax=Araneus ventricosus TaxID=182803 RepID=A0A4Y2P9T8_ARAVE|nr:hypothetical protein AVEN_98711-1 [Araneus ventricosus]
MKKTERTCQDNQKKIANTSCSNSFLFCNNMALSMPTSKGFTCLTAIIAVVLELARHFIMPRSVFSVSRHMRKLVPNFEQEWLKRVANNFVSRHEIRRIVKFISKNRYLCRPP